MRLLLDTHVLLWAAGDPDRLGEDARALLEDPATRPVFSAASLWEVAIKAGLGRADFRADPHELRAGLLANGWEELPVTGRHAVMVAALPPIHRDPFDRILVAQMLAEGVPLLTADETVARYPGPVRRL